MLKLFGAVSIEGSLGSRAFERSPDFAFPKAEFTQGYESLSVSFGHTRGCGLAVGRAICVTKYECSSAASLRNQTAAMQSSMVRGAQHHELTGVMASAFSAWRQVMHIEETRVLAARNYAAMAVSMHDLATHGRRNRLGCAYPRRLARTALLEVDLAAVNVSFPTELTFRAHVGSTTDVTF